MRTIGVITFARSDYSSCMPIAKGINADPELELYLMVSGMHLSPAFGCTLRDIEADGFEISEKVETLLSTDTPEGVAKSIGIGTISFAQSFTKFRPDILLIVGDRSELLSVASAALPLRIPIAHVSGGDITVGAIDNQVRHAMTKMSNMHFVAMQPHADRLLRMGEEPWRVHVTGEPALDLISEMQLLNRKELSNILNLELRPPLLLVTFHPTTLGKLGALEEIDNLLAALSKTEGTLIFTCPNADANNQEIVRRLQDFVAFRKNASLYQSLGQLKYYSLLSHADLMIGNSSSGIWEAPSFRLPVVNIGDRQQGRIRAGNVIDVPPEKLRIYNAIMEGLAPSFRDSLCNLLNPYGDGHATNRIIQILRQVELNQSLLKKEFFYHT
jgi:GDP/UDP-N,N'-diacetylbacillosamine 2-epimerase (hydrolysing)